MDDQEKQVNPAIAEPPTPATISRNDRGVAQAHDASSEYVPRLPAYSSFVKDIPELTPFNLNEDELHHIPAGSKDAGWQNCLNSIAKHDRELCQAYRKQIDTLLVFAGLFSAVVTAFAVESYQWLQDDPMDSSVELLRDMVGLLSLNLNLTVPPAPASAQRLSGAATVRINSFWFLSLMLSLSAALVGILCKQWLREFERNVGQSPETALAVRYVRFQGMEFWKVGSIVTSVPIIMQVALALFVIGIVELLWHLNTIAASCVTVTAGLTFAFYLATTFLPVMQYVYICMRCCVKPFRTRNYAFMTAYTQPQCAFKSAQAWLAFRVAQPVINHILRAFGYRFLSHHPPAFKVYTLRRTDSWGTFDLNWVKCRENIHLGPACAFECLTWIAANLEEMQMSAWIWHCVWARWLRYRYFPRDLSAATTDIESVARSYPRIKPLGDNITQLARSQALIFQCSLRSDLPINTALEILLRVATAAGAHSQWTSEALHAVCVVYRDQSFRLSDDIATGLYHLAELQSRTIILGPADQDYTDPYHGALAFKDIARILDRGTHLRGVFLPLMSDLVLQWLRSRPPQRVALAARAIFEDMIMYFRLQGYIGSRVRGLRQSRGIMFTARLAAAVAEIWPEYVRDAYEGYPIARAILRELLAMYSESFPEVSQDSSGARMEPPLAQVDDLQVHVDAEMANDERADLVNDAGEASQPSPQGYRSIEVHVEAETDIPTMETEVNCPSPPAGGSVAIASSLTSPNLSPDLPDTSVTSGQCEP